MLNPFFYPYSGGTEKHLLEVTKRLAKKHDVSILTAQIKGTKKKEEVNGVSIYRTNSWVLNDLPKPLPPPIPIMPFANSELNALCKENDLVHIHNRFVYGLNETGIVKKNKKLLGITLHNARPSGIDALTDFWGSAYDDTIGKTVMKRCDVALAVSKSTMNDTLPKDYSGIRQVAYNGVDSIKFQPQKLAKKRQVICVARLMPQKGLGFLIKAIAKTDARLLMVGKGPEEKKLRLLAKQNGDKTQFITDKISEEELARRYNESSVFCLPSLWEPFGMALCEAMACETPSVASAIGGIPEIIDDGKNSLLANPSDEIDLAEKINSLLADEKKARRLGINGRKKVMKTFTWDNTAKAYEKAYAKL